MTQRRPDRVTGPGHDDFWAWCKQRELRLQRCEKCKRLAWPVVASCEQCGSERFNWQRMSGRGKVVSWSQFHQDYYQGVLPVPYSTLLIELEEGPLFISNPADLVSQDIEFEMPVKVNFIDCEDAAGEFMLPVFERA